MALPRYLALTREEFAACTSMPEHPAWMACHFSPYGTGLTNLPPALPPDSMVILNDRIPMAGHDPVFILKQLESLDPAALLLDLQQQPCNDTLELVKFIVEGLACPVGVSAAYAKNLACPVFLPPVPSDTPLEEYLIPWKGREIWLELALDGIAYTVTGQGAISAPLSGIPESGQHDALLCCHYHIRVDTEQATFSLWRSRTDLENFLQKAESHGVTKAIGLWQELG